MLQSLGIETSTTFLSRHKISHCTMKESRALLVLRREWTYVSLLNIHLPCFYLMDTNQKASIFTHAKPFYSFTTENTTTFSSHVWFPSSAKSKLQHAIWNGTATFFPHNHCSYYCIKHHHFFDNIRVNKM